MTSHPTPGGGAAAYETTKAVDEYLQFHYAPAEQLLPYTDAPKVRLHVVLFTNHGSTTTPQSACNFAARCALLCERHCLALQDFTGELGAPTALDIGCAVGGATFELARVFPLVVGLDYSQHFVDAACAMQAAGRLPYTAVVEGDLVEQCEAVVDQGIDRSRVRFVRGDACNLPKQMRPVDCVLAANLLCRLPQPERFLADLPRLLKPGGVAVLVSPYSWLAAWTPRTRWLGGYYDASKVCVVVFAVLLWLRRFPHRPLCLHLTRFVASWRGTASSLWRRRTCRF